MSDPGDPIANNSAGARRTWADVGPRFASAMVLIVITASALYIGSYFFAGVVGAVYAGVYREWEIMVSRAPMTMTGWALAGSVALSALAYPIAGAIGTAVMVIIGCILAIARGRDGLEWRIGGIVLFGLLVVAILSMRGDTPAGIWAGVYLGTVIWMTDTAAFFSGRQIGGEKLAPGISPSKTWSGALGGLALGTGAGTLVWTLATDSPLWIGVLLSIVLSILGQAGDLSESAIKRYFRIKDSGDIIPGHGGLMDRLDSLTFGVILVLVVGGLHAGFGAVAEGLLYW
ncbi:MAG: phosphatidate cytidylyltransferase [Devosia sp.]|uniref:phosphatidate cytidylyltransferase n=1 Tax=Devosia sp. TaxID=1871048 RepID=UPI0024C646B0|nr:phosphatidate cytidylyltransferase [Devosia sp.]UYO00327.1 MAG: phosphatidate cytidylyltransferase [Devosia sp.]